MKYSISKDVWSVHIFTILGKRAKKCHTCDVFEAKSANLKIAETLGVQWFQGFL